MALALWIPLVHLAGATSVLVLAVFGLVNLALVALKRRHSAVVCVMPRPMWVSVAGSVTCFGLLAAQVLF